MCENGDQKDHSQVPIVRHGVIFGTLHIILFFEIVEAICRYGAILGTSSHWDICPRFDDNHFILLSFVRVGSAKSYLETKPKPNTLITFTLSR